MLGSFGWVAWGWFPAGLVGFLNLGCGVLWHSLWWRGWKFWCFVWFALGCWCLDLAWVLLSGFRMVYILLFRFGFAVRANCLEFAVVWVVGGIFWLCCTVFSGLVLS